MTKHRKRSSKPHLLTTHSLAMVTGGGLASIPVGTADLRLDIRTANLKFSDLD